MKALTLAIFLGLLPAVILLALSIWHGRRYDREQDEDVRVLTESETAMQLRELAELDDLGRFGGGRFG